MHDPIRENGWAFALIMLFAAMWLGPLMTMMGRDMFRRRKQETMTNPDPQNDVPMDPDRLERLRRDAVIADPGYGNSALDDDPQAAARKAAMAMHEKPMLYASPDDKETVARWEREGIDPSAVTTTLPATVSIGSAVVPSPMIQAGRTECPYCKGRGYVPGINDLLNESLALLGDSGDDVVRAFYSRLFVAAPNLRAIFPGDPTQGDLGTDHKGARQRELLLSALAALADLYDPADSDKMDRLDSALKRFGRTHASFDRKDGTVRGATIEEYAAVKDALFTTLIRTAQDEWKAEYSEAWGQAYDYAAGVMIAEQYRSGFTAPRFARA